jgi:hypothetical protein
VGAEKLYTDARHAALSSVQPGVFFVSLTALLFPDRFGASGWKGSLTCRLIPLWNSLAGSEQEETKEAEDSEGGVGGRGGKWYMAAMVAMLGEEYC